MPSPTAPISDASNRAVPRVALIHATPVAINPIIRAMVELWPEAEAMGLLDDSLSRDLARAGRLDDAMLQRFEDLAGYARGTGADAILFTCSAFGPAIERVQRKLDIPALKPNEAMFAEALSVGHRIALVVSFGPSVVSLRDELEQMARERGTEVSIVPVLVEPAMAALASGDGESHDRLIAETLAETLAETRASIEPVDVVLLGQFSMARAKDAVAAVTSAPVLTAPESAVRSLREAVERSLANAQTARMEA